MTNEKISARVKEIHKQAIVIDMLEALFPAAETWSPVEIGYFQTLVDAGVTAVHATIPDMPDDLSAAIRRTGKLYKAVESSGKAKIALTPFDIEAAKKEGKVAIILGMQEVVPFERELPLIEVFYKLGFRVLQLAYYRQNYLGAGCGESKDGGLTDQGREAVKELNRLGILIDISHCGDKTGRDAAEASKDPIAITHSTPATLVEFQRATSDEVIKAVAEKGGVMGQIIQTQFCERRNKMGVRPTLSDYVDIIDYLVNLVGVNHIGFGFDVPAFWTKSAYDSWFRIYGSAFLPHKLPPFEEINSEGFNSISDIMSVTEELVRHGYSDDDIKKIIGGNWLRLLKEVVK